jgi:hypothetical protein
LDVFEETLDKIDITNYEAIRKNWEAVTVH